MKNRVNKVFSILLYVLAGVLLIYTIWAFSHSAGYIGNLISSGQLTFAGNEFDIVNFYMTGCAQYFIFSVLLAVTGYIVRGGLSLAKQAVTQKIPVQKAESSEDNEIDEWFEGIRASGGNEMEKDEAED